MGRPFDILFTDLDGTLLDEQTYSFEAALPALTGIRALGIPLVPCTSKSFAETLPLLERLGMNGPLIIENGGAIYSRPGQISSGATPFRTVGHWERMDLGLPYSKLVEGLRTIRQQLHVSLIGFSDLTVEEVAESCGLTVTEARWAKAREFDEPFLFEQETPADFARVESMAQAQGMRVHRGGRFHHLTGEQDKGRAVRIILDVLSGGGPRWVSAGIGDSPNDLPMLQAVDIPVIVQRPSGQWDGVLISRLPWAIKAPGIGPCGWNVASLALLNGGA